MSHSKKKIIIVGPAYPYRGGNSLFISYVYETLSNHFQVKLFNYKILYPTILFPGSTQFDESQIVVKKVPNIRIVNSISPWNWIRVATKLKKEEADLIVFDWWHPFFAFCHFVITFLVRKKYKGRIAFITENVISHESHFIDRLLSKIGLRNADKFIALSDQVEKDLQEISKGRKIYKSQLPIFDVYNAKRGHEPFSKEDFGFSKTDKVLLFFGYVRKYKGLDILLNSLPTLIRMDSAIKLLIAGEFYEDPKPYYEIIKSLGIQNYIKIENKFISNEEVYKYFDSSDLVLLPYRSATQSGILNIAYAFKKPVIVTKVGGLSEFVEDEKTGIIIPTANVEEIRRGVERFYQIKDKINFEENIKALVVHNSFNILPELFDTIFSDL
jgi:D-inositol-3-phosphate glycosyltransferase